MKTPLLVCRLGIVLAMVLFGGRVFAQCDYGIYTGNATCTDPNTGADTPFPIAYCAAGAPGGSPNYYCFQGYGACPNGGVLDEFSPPITTANTAYDVSCYSGGGGGGGCHGSPIIIDTIGEGFKLTSEGDGVRFDIRGDGTPVNLAWTAKGSRNAFLALDRNGNGRIDSGKELFGNFTAQAKSAHPNGYLALSEFDKAENGGNDDGVIDWHDAVYSKLLLWIDENHDGISQPNELHHLWELGIYSLSLKYSDSRYTDAFGNLFRYKGRVNPLGQPPTDHTDRTSYDVFFVIGKPAHRRQGWGAINNEVEVVVPEVVSPACT